MAIAVQSSTTLAWASSSTADLTKPTGLAVGDLMIAHIGIGSGTVTTLAGWTAITSKTLTADTLKNYVFYKIADSADVAASSFTFSLSGSVTRAGGLIRIDGHSAGTPVYTSASGDATNATSPSFANTVTPIAASSLLLILGVVQQADTTSGVSGYAVTTSTPTFTETYDFNNAGGVAGTYLLCAASGTRSAVTATGNSTFTISVAANPDSVSHILVIPPSKDFTVTDTVTSSEPSVKGNIAATYTDTITTSETVDSTEARLWNKPTKPTTNWHYFNE